MVDGKKMGNAMKYYRNLANVKPTNKPEIELKFWLAFKLKWSLLPKPNEKRDES